MSDLNSKNSVTLGVLAKQLNISQTKIYHLILDGKIQSDNNRIDFETVERIKDAMNTYINVNDFASTLKGGKYNPKKSLDRHKIIDFFEINDYFGCNIFSAEDVIFAPVDCYDRYILKTDMPFLADKCSEILEWFGYSYKERSDICLKEMTPNQQILKQYITEELTDDFDMNLPSSFEFIELVAHATFVLCFKNSDVKKLLSATKLKETKNLLIDFFIYIRSHYNVSFSQLSKRRNTTKPMVREAYDYDTYVTLANILFNEDYAKKHDLVTKALCNPLYAKTWLFISAFFVCGWRGRDVCRNWRYPQLSEQNVFNINLPTLKDDLINWEIDNSTLQKVGKYIVDRVKVASNKPSKTIGYTNRAPILKLNIIPELQPVFGRITLICEYHQLNKNHNGHLNSNEIHSYTSWNNYESFFGQEMFALFGRKNLSTLSLNKSYLQGIERASRTNGATIIESYLIAAYARNHSNTQTTFKYLRDGHFTGETAEFVLYMMLQRGVFGAHLYKVFELIYPRTFEKLTMEEQTEVMKNSQISPYKLNLVGEVLIASDEIEHNFSNYKIKETKTILNAMLEIGLGYGAGKEKGVYCIKRALGDT